MNQKQRVITALNRKKPDFVPVFEWSIDRAVVEALAGSQDVFDLIDMLNIDGVVVRPDYKREFIGEDLFHDEWGSIRKCTNEDIALIVENPLKDIRDFKGYRFPDPYASHRFKTLERAITRFGETKAIILNVRDIFSDVRDILGYENALVSLVTQREYFQGLLERCIEYNRALAQIVYEKFNVNILVTTDDIADTRGLIFGPAVFYEFLGPRFKEVIRGFKNIGYYCIKHCDGNIMSILDYLIEAGVDCIDPIDPTAGMDIFHVKKLYGKRVCIKGNINCVTTLVSGAREDVANEVKECILRVGEGGGYILSSSNSIHSGVKPVNFRAMIEYTREFGKY